jgi:hypothetical protein
MSEFSYQFGPSALGTRLTLYVTMLAPKARFELECGHTHRIPGCESIPLEGEGLTRMLRFLLNARAVDMRDLVALDKAQGDPGTLARVFTENALANIEARGELVAPKGHVFWELLRAELECAFFVGSYSGVGRGEL